MGSVVLEKVNFLCLPFNPHSIVCCSVCDDYDNPHMNILTGLASQAANAVSLPNRINWLSEEEADQDQEHVR